MLTVFQLIGWLKYFLYWQFMQASHLNMNSREVTVPDFRVLTCSKTPILYVSFVS